MAAVTLIAITSAAAQTGPVAEACKDDITQYCADKDHGSGGIRDCLEENIDEVTDACKTALETTGGGQGQGRRKQQ